MQSIREIIEDSQKYIFRNPGKALVVACSMILAYGLYICTPTLNIDDIFIDFFNGGRLIAAGHFSAYLLQFFTGIMTYTPFFTMALALCVYYLAGLSSGMILQHISGNKLSANALFVHWLVFVTYPIISEQMIYPIIVLFAIGYLIVSLSIYMEWKVIVTKERQWSMLILSIVLLALAIDFYESFASVFLTIALEALCLSYYYGSKGYHDVDSWKVFFIKLIKIGVILITAVILRQLISMTFMYGWYGTWHSGYSGNSSLYWIALGWFDCAIWLIRTMFVNYIFASTCNLAIFTFTFCWMFMGWLAIMETWRQHSLMPLVLWILLVASALSLNFVLGLATAYRMAQALVPFVAFSMMMLFTYYERSSKCKVIVSLVIALFIMNFVKSLSDASFINVKRHQYEMAIVDRIGNTLQENYPVTRKPVVFIGSAKSPALPVVLRGDRRYPHPIYKQFQRIPLWIARHLLSKKFYKSIGSFFKVTINDENDLLVFTESLQNPFPAYISYLSWVKKYPSWYGQYEEELPGGFIYGLFEERGYTLLRCTDEQLCDGMESNGTMPAYPCEGYIKEMDDKILVNLGE